MELSSISQKTKEHLADRLEAKPLQGALTANALFILGVAVVFSLVSSCARLAFDAGSNALTVVALRTPLVGIALWVYLRARGVSCQLPPFERNWALVLGVVLALSTLALNKALEIIPVPIAILIFYTYPLLTSMASWVTRTERFSLRVAIALAIAFSGLALTLQVKGGPLNATGLAYAFVGAVGFASLFYLSGRIFRGGDSRPRTLHMMVSGSLLVLLVCAVTGDIAFPSTQKGWIAFWIVPVIYGMAIIGNMAAVISSGAMKSAAYMNFEPVSTILFSAIFLEQFMTATQLTGAGLVVGALLLFRMPAIKSD